MKKRVTGKKFGRNTKARKAMYNSLIRSLVISGKIKTTKTKAKATQSQIDGLINKAKTDTVHTRRQIEAALSGDKETTTKIFRQIAPLFKSVTSGFTKLTPLNIRKGDGAMIATLQWSQTQPKEGTKPKKINKIIKK